MLRNRHRIIQSILIVVAVAMITLLVVGLIFWQEAEIWVSGGVGLLLAGLVLIALSSRVALETPTMNTMNRWAVAAAALSSVVAVVLLIVVAAGARTEAAWLAWASAALWLLALFLRGPERIRSAQAPR